MTSVSCLTVTQAGRLESLADAARCLSAQSHGDIEFVIVHDGDHRVDREIRAIAASEAPRAPATVHRAEPASLGELREQGVRSASGDVVCQWDDDDLSHPTRVERQLRRLDDAEADACFLTEQLHLFATTTELCVEDWTVDRFPLCFVAGSLLARRDRLPPYRHLHRGEDTHLVLDLVRSGRRVTGLQDSAHLFAYVYHGGNAFSESHHRRIAASKGVDLRRAPASLDELRAHLRDYPLQPTRYAVIGGAASPGEVTLGAAR